MKNLFKLFTFFTGSNGKEVKLVGIDPGVIAPVIEECPFTLSPDELVELERMPDPGPPFELEVPDDLIDPLIEDRLNFADRQVQEQKPFVWKTDKGEYLIPVNMATPHLFYTLRMLFNHSVPPAFRVGDFKRHGNVSKWPLDYRVQAGNAMKDELKRRLDVEPWMKFEMIDMEENAAFLSIRQVPYKDPVVGGSDQYVYPPEAIASLLNGAPPYDAEKLKRVNADMDRRVRALGKRTWVRGYTRANGNKVKGYFRSL